MRLVLVLVATLFPSTGDLPKDRFGQAGIEDPEDVRRFLGWLKSASSDGDKHILTAMVRYPFRIWSSGKVLRVYPTQTSLLADFDRVFTAQVRAAICESTLESLFVNSQGVMIGDGEVWFDRREDGVRIKAVNNRRR